MEILKIRYEYLLQALASLQDSLNLMKDYSVLNDSKIYEMCSDSCIYRFKYSFDAFWKFIKLYLEECENIELENNSPRYIFKTAENTEILLKHENLDILIQALSDRNLTSHSYNVEIAEKIVGHIPLYYQTMHLIITQLKLKIR